MAIIRDGSPLTWSTIRSDIDKNALNKNGDTMVGELDVSEAGMVVHEIRDVNGETAISIDSENKIIKTYDEWVVGLSPLYVEVNIPIYEKIFDLDLPQGYNFITLLKESETIYIHRYLENRTGDSVRLRYYRFNSAYRDIIVTRTDTGVQISSESNMETTSAQKVHLLFESSQKIVLS